MHKDLLKKEIQKKKHRRQEEDEMRNFDERERDWIDEDIANLGYAFEVEDYEDDSYYRPEISHESKSGGK
jgi:hypothetical protein